MKKQSLKRSFLLLIAICTVWQIAYLQPIKDGLPQLTDKYAIVGATVIPSPGKKIENATILIEKGVIKMVGTDVRIPKGYYKVKADSMYLYAGFIDGLSHTGIKEEKMERPDGLVVGNPPRDWAGIQPERKADAMIAANDKSIGDMRALGFTISNVVPDGRMLPGSGALVLLSGKSIDQMLLKPNTGMYAQLQGARGAYPATIIGVMAKFRELYKNAQNAATHDKAFSLGGVAKPNYDESVKALIPVTNKSMTVYYNTPDLLSIYRVLALQKELDFKIALTDVKQSWGLEDRILNEKIPVLLSLDLPEEKEDKKEKAKKKDSEEDDEAAAEKEIEDATKDDKVEDESEDEVKDEAADEIEEAVEGNIETKEERDALEERRKDSEIKHYKIASDLAKKNIPFSFTSVSAKSKDIKKNIHLMIKNGLTEDQALAALTTNPANLLGISKFAGTVEKGKMANLVITNKPYFDEKSKVKYVFVNGDLYEYEIKPEKKKKDKKEGDSDSTAPSDVAGTYSFTVEVPGDTQSGSFTISGTKGAYTGTIVNDDDPEENELSNIQFNDGTLTFEFVIDGGMAVNFSAEIDGEEYEGEVSVGAFGSFPVEGSKKSGPKN